MGPSQSDFLFCCVQFHYWEEKFEFYPICNYARPYDHGCIPYHPEVFGCTDATNANGKWGRLLVTSVREVTFSGAILTFSVDVKIWEKFCPSNVFAR